LKYYLFGVRCLFNVWVNKQVEDDIKEKQIENNLIIFNLFDKNNKSNVKTDAEQLWRRFGLQSLSNISEDLLIIAISVFCADKRIPRKNSFDNWTRNIKLHLPVLELEKWNAVRAKLEKTLGFLSGDKWVLEFRKSKHKFRANKKNTKYKLINKKKFDSVSLFSGGLDSFCGAITILERGENTCFVGFREYNLLTSRQKELFNALDSTYPSLKKELVLFNVNPLAPLKKDREKAQLGTESSSRSRSFLFLAGAIAIASIIGDGTPVYISENGFIGINVPLTDSRNGSCSTRTTHPIFLKSLNQILQEVGLNHQIQNFYWNRSKGQIVAEHKDKQVFQQNAHKTLSCSHPCLSRYDKIKPPCNCGYCYPCLIRRASLYAIGKDKTPYNQKYKLNGEFIQEYNNLQGKASDLKALLFSIRRYLKHRDDTDYIRALLLRQGALSHDELIAYERLYHQSMKELIEMIKQEDAKNNGGLLDYIGIGEKI
jgi:7-cyano-7-deazaguanine synthase in queuosine biosynthesis